METKHARIFQYQDEWRRDNPEVNLSQLVRQRLTLLIPDDQIPDGYDESAAEHLPSPILGYGGGAGFCDFTSDRVHLTLEPFQYQWVEQTATFSFSVFVQGQLDRQIPDGDIPEQRRESLEQIGVLNDQESPDSQEASTPQSHD